MEKILKENVQPIVTAMDIIIDKADYFKEELEKYPLEVAEEVKDYVNGLYETSKEFESIRGKLLSGDFNLSLTEIDRCALALLFAREGMLVDMEALKIGIMKTADLAVQLIGDDKALQMMENFRKFGTSIS